MAQQLVRGGAPIDIPTADEVADAVDPRMRAFWAEQRGIAEAREREQLRTMKDLRRSAMLTTPATTRPTVLDGISPEAGYKWVVRLVGVFLASAGTGQAFITSDSASALGVLTQGRPVAALTTSAQFQVATFPQGACVLDEGEGLYLNFTTNINGYTITGWEVMAEQIGKLA